MSNILKKITKKYKWLRFLNYKTTKLAVLSAALFGLCLSSGASFAKYRDENYGGGNAGVVKFEYGYVTYNPAPIQQPTDEKNIKEGMHAFICEFYLEIPTVEVSISYSLKLRLVESNINDFDIDDDGLSGSSFFSESDNNAFYTFGKNGDTIITNEQKTVSQITGQTLDYSKEHFYYAFGTENNDSTITYTWDKSNEFAKDKNGNITKAIAFDSGRVDAGSSLTKYYKILIFVNAEKKSGLWSAESSKILYSYEVIQEV